MRLILTFFIATAIGLANSPARAQTSGLAQIAEMAAAGRCAQAYEILAPLEFEMAGSVEFDLLFAYCALEIGETGLAMLALDRVLSIAPSSPEARFLLARAYFLLDDLDAARREFELLLSFNPTPALGDSIGQYLDAIASRRPDGGLQASGFLALGIGHDTNVTDGASDDLIYIPGLDQNFSPSASEAEDADNYAGFTAGFDIVRPVGAKSSIYAGGDLSVRAHDEIGAFDYGLTSLRAGYRHAWRNQSLRVGGTLSDWRLDGDAFRDDQSIEIEWRNTVTRRNEIGIAAAYSRFRHDEELDTPLDYDDSRLRVAYSRLLGKRGERLIVLAVDVGSEAEQNRRDDGDKDYVALQISWQTALNDRASAFLRLSSQSDDYARVNSLFGEKRRESQSRIAGGVIWYFRESTSLRATLVASETDSNLALYDNDGRDFSITLRRDFY